MDISRKSDPPQTTAIRGPVLTYGGDAFAQGLEATVRYEPDAIVAMAGGRITHFGSADEVQPQLAAATPIRQYGSDSLIMAGFIDCHAHYPQTQVIGSHGQQLIDWLHKYTFVAEQQFADKAHASEAAQVFLQECLRAGTTTAAVFCTVHPQSVDALFEQADALNMRLIAGKVLMDRLAPAALADTARQGYDDSKALIAKWHGKGRLLYAVTPRFALTSSPEQMELAGALWAESPGTYLQSHVSENRDEVAQVLALYPQRTGYLD
ncbi:MAG TPA: guanine deaminase, partial [Burkholderiaceae bacterium]